MTAPSPAPAPYAYTTLSADDRRAIIDGRVRQFESELFGHELNRANAAALPADNPERANAEKAADDAIKTLTQRIDVAKAERAKIK